MLTAHAAAPERRLSGAALAAAGGFSDWKNARAQYSVVGRALAGSMLFEPRARTGGAPMWWLVVADADDAHSTDEEVVWTLREALAEAL